MSELNPFDGDQLSHELLEEIAFSWIGNALDSHDTARGSVIERYNLAGLEKLRHVGNSIIYMASDKDETSGIISATIDTKVIPEEIGAPLVREPAQSYVDTVLAMLIEFTQSFEHSSSLTNSRLVLNVTMATDRTAEEISHLRQLVGDDDPLELTQLRRRSSPSVLLLTPVREEKRSVIFRSTLDIVDFRLEPNNV